MVAVEVGVADYRRIDCRIAGLVCYSVSVFVPLSFNDYFVRISIPCYYNYNTQLL